MDADDRRLLRELVVGGRVVSLAVVVEGEPVVGLLPYLARTAEASLFVHTSALARHSRGLVAGAPFGALVHAALLPEADALAVPRVTFAGHVEAVGAAETAPLREAYIERFPSAELTVALGDFAFHRLRIRSGRLVAGFGRALNLSLDSIASLQAG